MDVSEVDFSRPIKAQPKEQYVKHFVAESPKTLSRAKLKIRKETFKVTKESRCPGKKGKQ